MYSNIRPTLNLDFANSQTVDPRITFTRTGTAAYYDGKTTVKAEENLLAYSQEFDNAAWVKPNATVTANTSAAPDGTTTAETVNEGTTSAYHQLEQTITTVASGSYTVSLFLKYVDRQYVNVSFYSNATGSLYAAASFDILNGTVSNTGALGTGYAVSGASITSAGNGWYRCTLSVTNGTASLANTVAFATSDTGTVSSYGLNTFTGTSKTFLVWGAQLEQRSTVTAYTPTTTQAITNYIPAIQYAPANTPRIDFDPITGECKGLLIEEQRTNLLTYSEQFDNGVWGKGNVTIAANTVIAPDGTLFGDKVVESATTGDHALSQTITAASGSYSFTVYLKGAERSRAIVLMSDNISGEASIGVDLSTGATFSSGRAVGSWTAISSSAASVGNGWYRVTVTGTRGAGTQTVPVVFCVSTGTTTSYTGNGYSGVYIWGAQLEAGAFPTSYIPTVASQVTRGADSASMTGVNFSSWYRADEGTLYAECASVAETTNSPAFSIGVTDDRIEVRFTGQLTTSSRALTYASGVSQADIATQNLGAAQNRKVICAYKFNDFLATANGVAVQGDTVVVVPVISQAQIGTAPYNSALKTNGTIRKIAYYPLKLSSTQLQALTA